LQIPNPKKQIPNNAQIPNLKKAQVAGSVVWRLAFEICLGFVF
jgi:hypothetical protein